MFLDICIDIFSASQMIILYQRTSIYNISVINVISIWVENYQGGLFPIILETLESGSLSFYIIKYPFSWWRTIWWIYSRPLELNHFVPFIWELTLWCLVLEQRLVNLLCKGPDSKYFSFCRPYGRCQNFSTTLLQHWSSHRQLCKQMDVAMFHYNFIYTNSPWGQI